MAIPNGFKLDSKENDTFIGKEKVKQDNNQEATIIIEVSRKNGTITYFQEFLGGSRQEFFVQNASGTNQFLSNGKKFVEFFKDGEFEKIRRIGIKNAKKIIKTNENETERKKILSEPLYSETPSATQPERVPGESEDEGNNNVSAGVFGITSEKFQEDKPFQQKFLRYPEDINSNQDRILITQKRYEAPDVLNGDGNIDTSKIISGAFSEERFKNKDKVLGSVTLPMPNDISESNVTAWGEDSLSSLAALIGGAALGTVGPLAGGNIPESIEEIKKALGEVFDKTTAANQTVEQLLTLNAASAITKKLGINLNAEAFRSRITGTAINPNLELLFQGPKLRSFAFQFKMTPRSDTEARNIRYILKFFKKGMAAKRNFSDSEAAYFLGAPNVFDIQFKSNESGKEIDSIGKIKTCALQQCVVNYTPDGFYAAFRDENVGSQPIAVVMQLAFTELTPLYNDNYNEDNTNSVGFDLLRDGPSGTQN